MRGLIAMTHAASTAAAYDDWLWLTNLAKQRGFGDAVYELWPRANAGHRTIDKQLGKLKKMMGLPEDVSVEQMRVDPQYR